MYREKQKQIKTIPYPCLHFLLVFTSYFPLTTHLCPCCSSSSTEGMGIQLVHNCSSLLLLLHAFACCNVSPSHVLQDKVALEWALHQIQFLLYQSASTGPPLLWCLDPSFPFFPGLGVFTILSNTSFPLFTLVFWAFLKYVIIRGATGMALGLAMSLCLAQGSSWPLRESTASSTQSKPGHKYPKHTTKCLLKGL